METPRSVVRKLMVEDNLGGGKFPEYMKVDKDTAETLDYLALSAQSKKDLQKYYRMLDRVSGFPGIYGGHEASPGENGSYDLLLSPRGSGHVGYGN